MGLLIPSYAIDPIVTQQLAPLELTVAQLAHLDPTVDQQWVPTMRPTVSQQWIPVQPNNSTSLNP
jgi:hypothetical protein